MPSGALRAVTRGSEYLDNDGFCKKGEDGSIFAIRL